MAFKEVNRNSNSIDLSISYEKLGENLNQSRIGTKRGLATAISQFRRKPLASIFFCIHLWLRPSSRFVVAPLPPCWRVTGFIIFFTEFSIASSSVAVLAGGGGGGGSTKRWIQTISAEKWSWKGDVTEFYRVLPSVTECYRVLPSFVSGHRSAVLNEWSRHGEATGGVCFVAVVVVVVVVDVVDVVDVVVVVVVVVAVDVFSSFAFRFGLRWGRPFPTVFLFFFCYKKRKVSGYPFFFKKTFSTFVCEKFHWKKKDFRPSILV